MIRNVIFTSLILILAACSGGGDENTVPQVVQNTPTPEPTLTIQERTQFEAGRRENPLQMVIRPVDAVNVRISEILTDLTDLRSVEADTEITDELADSEIVSSLNEALSNDFAIATELQSVEGIATVGDLTSWVQRQIGQQVSASIFDRTSLYVDVVIVENYADALSALCNSGTGIVGIPFLDGMTYAAADALNCGLPALQVAVASMDMIMEPEATEEPEATPEVTAEPDNSDTSMTVDLYQLSTGRAGVVVVDSSLSTTNLSLIVDRTYCRISLDDFYSWFVPALMLEQEGLDLLYAPSDVVELDNYADLLEAIDDSDCAMTGVPADMANDDLLVAATSVEFPYGILMYPIEVGLGVRLSLSEHLQALSVDPEDGQELAWLLGQAALVPAAPNDFSELRQFIDGTGYDLAQLGN